MPQNENLISKVRCYVESYMNKFDGSHDFNHIKRVVGLAHVISSSVISSSTKDNPKITPILDPTVITLSALLHDVGDRKYLQEGQDPTTQVLNLLLNFGASPSLAGKVQTICLGVSWNSEMKNPAHVLNLIAQHPELAVVQDADRLDSIGAVGIGRLFTYGGAKTTRDMHAAVEMMDFKLFELEKTMKTEPGKRMAREATERMRMWREWWGDEVGLEGVGTVVLDEAVKSESSAARTEAEAYSDV
ncbi:hypothetical protein VTL71DRAFT_14319 [Oculimacula yallundae]|uniref:HD/PDEase domain-containing protein n=1 Tax=Oculimacula yallundae TaxID=86028 RepID=A0ABR4CIS3_9HELO